MTFAQRKWTVTCFKDKERWSLRKVVPKYGCSKFPWHGASTNPNRGPGRSGPVVLRPVRNPEGWLAEWPPFQLPNWWKVPACDKGPFTLTNRPNRQNDRVRAPQNPSGCTPVPKMPRKVVCACMGICYDRERKLSFTEEGLSAADNTPVLQIDLLPSPKYHRLAFSPNSAPAHNEKGVEVSIEMAGVKRVLCSEGLAIP